MSYEPYDPPAARIVRLFGYTLAGIIAVFVLLILALFAFGHARFYENVRGIPPKELGTGAFYSGELNDPRGLVQFSFSSAAAYRIESDPKAFFAAIPNGSEWKPTPAPWRETGVSDCMGFWCTRGGVATNGRRWATRPGSYYRRWGKSDDFLVIINPHEEQVIVGYFYS